VDRLWRLTGRLAHHHRQRDHLQHGFDDFDDEVAIPLEQPSVLPPFFVKARKDPMNPSQHDEGLPERSLHNLIYCSLASPNMDPAEIHKIIATAKHHNPRYGITGLLVYGSGIFFQWLEGPKDNVTSLMNIIGEDPRHLNVVVLSEEDEIRDRLFPDWDMELVEAAEIGDVLKNALKEASDEKQKQMLSMFLTKLQIA
jgi:hypothetical protein